MEARHLELYELLKPTLGEQPAQALVLALPARPEELATKGDVALLKSDLLALRESLRAEMDVRFSKVDARFDRLESVLTRRMVTITGAWTLLFATAFAWAAAFFH